MSGESIKIKGEDFRTILNDPFFQANIYTGCMVAATPDYPKLERTLYGLKCRVPPAEELLHPSFFVTVHGDERNCSYLVHGVASVRVPGWERRITGPTQKLLILATCHTPSSDYLPVETILPDAIISGHIMKDAFRVDARFKDAMIIEGMLYKNTGLASEDMQSRARYAALHPEDEVAQQEFHELERRLITRGRDHYQRASSMEELAALLREDHIFAQPFTVTKSGEAFSTELLDS